MGNRADHINIINKLSAKRLWNASKIWTSYQRSKLGSKVVHSGMPMSLAFEPTTSCNLRCPECPSGLRSFTRPTGMLEKGLFENTIEELHKTLIYLTLYFQGEPYLHPQFYDLIRYAADRKIYTATSTNAHFLDDENARKTIESGLDRLIISIDGVTQKSYSSYRVGGSLDKVIDGTKNIIAWKKKLKSKTPHLIFQFLVVKPNEHQIENLYSLAHDLGIDEVRLKTAQIYDYENGSDLIPDNDKYSRYKQKSDGTWAIKNHLENRCWKMWQSSVITWDGKLVPCCFDKDAHHSMGSLNDSSFKEIWTSDAYNQFRSSIFKSRSEIEMCKNCTEGTKVWT